MPAPASAIPLVRLNLFLHHENAAKLRLACVDTTFGGVRYGEQTRIVNLALRQYFERNENVQPRDSSPDRSAPTDQPHQTDDN